MKIRLGDTDSNNFYAQPLWKELDDYRTFINNNDQVFYAHEYTKFNDSIDKNTELGRSVDNISNFKMELKFENINRYYYRTVAIKNFVNDLQKFDIINPCIVVPDPTSKMIGSKAFNPRLNEVVEDFSNRKRLFYENPIIRTMDTLSMHERPAAERNPSVLQETFEYVGFSEEINTMLESMSIHNITTNIYLIDDVITKGTSYRAYKDFLLLNCKYNVNLIGLYWGKYIEYNK